ncbi:hypothetical protein N9D66_02165, partial [Candidatus Nanopelagicales bacterium]|nr:hypothetical protein [Candidatus Nanopelagicales bacterium]
MSDRRKRLDKIAAASKPEIGYTTAEIDAELARMLRILDGPDCPERREYLELMEAMDSGRRVV